MRTIALISVLAAGLSPVPVLLAQPAPALALNSVPLSLPDLRAAISSAGVSLAPKPEAAAAIVAVSNIVPAQPCRTSGNSKPGANGNSADEDREPCVTPRNPYSPFLDTAPAPLTPGQKAAFAGRILIDPGNLATILDTSAFIVGSNAHTAYGPGWRGFRRNVGYSFSQDATADFFGAFLIPAVAHQDPRYRRIPAASVPRRALHAVAATVLAQSDDGKPMPNYANLLTNPICTEIANLYVPGVNGNGPSTVARIMTGYAGAPVDNLITEFLPDVARRIHVRVIFVQQILNQISSDPYSPLVQ